MGGTYEDLEVWQTSMDLVVKTCAASRNVPADERYGLTNQLRRAAVSVASNIAEGKGRISDKELLQFLSRARGSLYEVQTQLRVAKALHYPAQSLGSDLSNCGDRVGCLLNGLIRSVNSSVAKASRSKEEIGVAGMARAESRTAKA
jgi:four helix bundle protein